MLNPQDRAARMQALARRLLLTEAELRDLTGGEIDALVDPLNTSPLLLRGAQESLREAEARSRELIEKLPIIACELNVDGTTRFVSNAVTAILGYTPSELTGRRWWAALGVHPSDGNGQQLHELEGNYERAVHARDGAVRNVVWTSTAAHAVDGSVRSYFLFGLDLTERRQAEGRRASSSRSSRRARPRRPRSGDRRFCRRPAGCSGPRSATRPR
jgi:PAS domain S-box-containing protein